MYEKCSSKFARAGALLCRFPAQEAWASGCSQHGRHSHRSACTSLGLRSPGRHAPWFNVRVAQEAPRHRAATNRRAASCGQSSAASWSDAQHRAIWRGSAPSIPGDEQTLLSGRLIYRACLVARQYVFDVGNQEFQSALRPGKCRTVDNGAGCPTIRGSAQAKRKRRYNQGGLPSLDTLRKTPKSSGSVKKTQAGVNVRQVLGFIASANAKAIATNDWYSSRISPANLTKLARLPGKGKGRAGLRDTSES